MRASNFSGISQACTLCEIREHEVFWISEALSVLNLLNFWLNRSVNILLFRQKILR